MVNFCEMLDLVFIFSSIDFLTLFVEEHQFSLEGMFLKQLEEIYVWKKRIPFQQLTLMSAVK
jgi:hypothetical protein